MSENKELMETKSAEKKQGSKKKKKKVKNFVIAGAVLAAVGVGGYLFMQNKKKEVMSSVATAVQTATVTRMNISSELSASSSLSPKDTYELTALVEGEVLEAPFEEGDVVEKGQVLYVIDATSMDSEVSSAETSLVRAQENLQTVQEEYNEAVSKVTGNTYKATKTGYIKELLISEGDKVGNGTKIAELYDDSIMKITVPFLSTEADQIVVGNEAIVTLEDTGEQLPGTVTIVSSLEEVLSGGRLVKAVTIEVANPGGLTTLTQATASVGSFVCSNEGTFTAKTEAVLSADLSGSSSLEVGSMLVTEGSYVTKGTPLFTATSKSVKKYIDSFENSVESAKDSLKNAENKLTNTQDSLDNYTITAPISGTVIRKNAKVGDNVTKGSGSSALAVIYDLSAMTLEMSVDELDVRNVKAGQDVTITADAIEGEVFSGTVTNVSLQSSYSQGVTNYPVTITMEETGDLLPGMNVDVEIILEQSENALVIPVGALMRGNRVYVKSDSASEQGAAGKSERGERPSMPEGMGTGMQQAGVPEGFTAVRVETGIVTDDYVEILSGLSEGDEVYVDPSAGTTMNMFQMGGFPGGMQMGGMPNRMSGGASNRGGMPSGGMGGRP